MISFRPELAAFLIADSDCRLDLRSDCRLNRRLDRFGTIRVRASANSPIPEHTLLG